MCARRSKLLPEGGHVEERVVAELGARVWEAVRVARTAGELRRDDEARAIWRKIYRDLSEGRPGLLGAVTSRSEAQVTRLSLVFALLDSSPVITGEHLLAALAVWTYCEASARFVFGEALGDPVADEILHLLKRSPEGVTRSEISNSFGRHKRSGDIDRALGTLAAAGLAASEKEETGESRGRPVEKWFAVGAKKAKKAKKPRSG